MNEPIAVPPDTELKSRVELIQQYARYVGRDDWAALATKLGNIGVIAERLAVLLDDPDGAAHEALVTALAQTDDALAQAGWSAVSRPRAPMRAALARVKGES